MRRFARVSAMFLAALLASACSDYLPNAPDPLPVGSEPQTDRGLVVEVTSTQDRVAQEGEVEFTVTTSGGNGSYRYSWTIVDCYEDTTGREQCTWHNALAVEGGPVINFTRFRRAIDTKMTITVMAHEVIGVKSGQDVHYLLGPNDRAN